MGVIVGSVAGLLPDVLQTAIVTMMNATRKSKIIRFIPISPQIKKRTTEVMHPKNAESLVVAA